MRMLPSTAGSPGHRPAQRPTNLGSCLPPSERPRRFWGMGLYLPLLIPWAGCPQSGREWVLPLPAASPPGPAFPSHPHLTLLTPGASLPQPANHKSIFCASPWKGWRAQRHPAPRGQPHPEFQHRRAPRQPARPCPAHPLAGADASVSGRAKACVDWRAIGKTATMPAPLLPGKGARTPSGTQTWYWPGFGTSQEGPAPRPATGFC